MIKKQLNKLIVESYSGNNLDIKKVEKIAKDLKRKNLKLYIRAIKNLENQRSVIVSLPKPLKKTEMKIMEKIYKNKKIVYDIDPNLMLGMKIKDNDMLYEMDLKNTLDDLVEYIGGTND